MPETFNPKTRKRNQHLLREYSPAETPKHTSRRWLKEGGFSLAVALFSFTIFLFVLFPLTGLLPDSYTLGTRVIPIKWDMLGNMTSLATFSLVVGGVFFAYREYVQNEVQRKREESESSFQFYKQMYDRLMNPESMAARRWVILNLPTLDEVNDDTDAWLKKINRQVYGLSTRSNSKRSPGQEYIKHILNDFDYIGFVHGNYWKIEGELDVWINPPVAKVWERIWLYVEEEAKLRNEPDYYAAARAFGDHCMQWRREHRPKSNVIKNGT